MLMQLGPVSFKVAPVNIDSYDHGHEATFAEKPVIGARMPFEYVGEGRESWTIKGRLFPKRFGGQSGLQALMAARASGQPQYLMRGDGALMGWVVILSVTERSRYLSADGVGQEIEVDISVARSDPPGAAGFYAAVMGMLS